MHLCKGRNACKQGHSAQQVGLNEQLNEILGTVVDGLVLVFCPSKLPSSLKSFQEKKKTCRKELNWNELIKFGNIHRKKGSRLRM